MGLEPHVNAINVKPMIAVRQKSSLFTLHNLRETNRTFQTLLPVFGCENRHGKGGEDGGVETGSERTVLTGGKDEAAAVAAAPRLRGGDVAVAPPEASGKEMKTESNYDNEEHEYNEDHHYLSG